MKRPGVPAHRRCQERATAGVVAATALALLTALAPAPASADPIDITSGATFATSTDLAAALVANLIGLNTGITIVGTPTYTGALGAAGLFTGGTGILPFDAGVALTTGLATSIPGPNVASDTGTANGTPGDASLSALAGVDTLDAAILAFSFIPDGDTISFQYVFGSEEYEEFVGGAFNDVFAFGLNGTNIALIPGTGTPVSINNVNGGANTDYYASNTGGTLNIEYDGLVGTSVVFTLSASGGVTPGAVNTITMGIADAFDDIYDSGVMLAQGSFATNAPPPPAVPEPATLVLFGTGLAVAAARVQNRRGRK
jgi:hypothetical protein